MKLLIDHDVYRVTVDFLRQHGQDAITAKELGLPGRVQVYNLNPSFGIFP